jgi:thioredoxin-related protein
MTALLVIVVVLLVIITVFVTALTASYASLERRLDRLEGLGGTTTSLSLSPRAPAVATGVGGAVGRAANDIVGTTLSGDPRAIAIIGVPHHTLLAFLSSGCTTCGRFWSRLREGDVPNLGDDTRLVVMTKGLDQESMVALDPLARGVDVVMSTDAWRDYEVPGTPFFIFVDGSTGTVRGEGTALGWNEVLNLVALGRGDASVVTGVSTASMKPSSDAEREAIVDQVLMDAGIFPGDRSLYPGVDPTEIPRPPT